MLLSMAFRRGNQRIVDWYWVNTDVPKEVSMVVNFSYLDTLK